jgi:prephenate dehydrogenase
MNVLVVGAGTMGRWVGRVLTDASQSVAVTDADPATTREAAAQLDCRVFDPDDADGFDVVCLAVPMPAIEPAIAEYAPLAERAVVDVAGTMTEPLAAMADHAPGCARASFHPLFAPENEPGSVPVVVDSQGRDIETMRAALEARDNHVFETTAAEHDDAMATVQAKTHAAVLAFGLAVEEVDPAFHTPVSSVLAELLEQVTSGSPGVYADIQEQFAGADDIAAAAESIASADRERFEQLYETASPDQGGGE